LNEIEQIVIKEKPLIAPEGIEIPSKYGKETIYFLIAHKELEIFTTQ
jgi:hypothetical protein